MISSILYGGVKEPPKLSNKAKTTLVFIDLIFSPISVPVMLIVTLVTNIFLLVINVFKVLIHLITNPKCSLCLDYPGYKDSGCKGVILNKWHVIEILTHNPAKWLFVVPGIFTIFKIVVIAEAARQKSPIPDLFINTQIPVFYYQFEDEGDDS
ncbi:hypothetical protein CLAVI_000800 [Candidatus Clavichlamydia salmonicola]|uniref:hypothetical protein n=1 Tax=Candidatus Clavichlamydia salmonicola TaxID=469812 RepID=UPI001891C402|nr:hypothetical protein [Candidatus Clavichlamydia salmonicola]MBF5051164.1 hypothetical protein [Candidatus Clavichlamydia salmonicola]